MKINVLLVLLLFTFSLQAQEDEEQEQPPSPETVTEDSIHSLVHGNNTFAVSLYRQLKSLPGNLFFSPYCITSALAMPYAGARAGTQSQMQATLHFLPQSENLDLAIAEFNKRVSKPWMQGPNEIRLMIANGLWIQRNLRLENDFLDRMRRYFGTTLRQADFMRNPDAARLNINEWVREGTQGRISNMVDRSDITKETRMVVVSSIFMKAVWQYPFDARLTLQAPFFLDPKTTVSVPMMQLTKQLRVLQHSQFTLLELPYSSSPIASSQLDLILLLPTVHGGLSQVETLIGSGDLERWLKGLQTETVVVSLPRFKFTSSIDLAAALKQMGMPVAFSNLADFSGIFGGGGLALDKVLHKAYISVDEKGTEAIAATAVSINVTSMPQERPPVVFKADHPFVFVIKERTTGAILFMGRFGVPTT